MAADVTAEVKAHVPLTADVGAVVNLTGQFGNWVEVVNPPTATESVYVTLAEEEDELPDSGDWAIEAPEWDVVLPGERLPLPAPKDGGVWAVMISAGETVASLIGVNDRWQ